MWTDAKKIPGGEAWLRSRWEDTIRAAMLDARPAGVPVEALRLIIDFFLDVFSSGKEPNVEDSRRLRDAVLQVFATQHAQPPPESGL